MFVKALSPFSRLTKSVSCRIISLSPMRGTMPMKLLHLSDLHLGRLLHRYSLQEEQAELLTRIVKIAAEEKPDAVLIAGDV